MARVRRRGQRADLRRARERRKSPCLRPPAQPTGLTGSFDRDEGGRENRIRAKLRWDEVTTNTAGAPITIRAYKVEIEYSANGFDWFLRSRHTVPAKDDTDPNTKAHLVLRGFRRRLRYRYRVRPIGRDGCKGPWSDWFMLGSPGPEEPPAPTNVTLVGKLQRIVADWDLPEDPADTDPDVRTVDPRIAHVQFQIATDAGFTNVVKRGRFDTREHMSWTPPDALASATFYFRIRSINPDGTPSAWAVANDGVGVQLASAAGQLVLVWSIHGKWRTGRIKKRWLADGTYLFRKARIYVGDHDPATHPDDWCPLGSRLRVQGKVVSADESVETNLFDTDDRLIVEPGTHKDVNWASSFAVPQITDGETLLWDVRSVGSTFPGRDGTITLVVERV